MLGTVRTIVRDVGSELYRRRHVRKRIQYKGATDLVTQFDRSAQAALVRRLTRHYPEIGILSEERLSRRVGARARWIVDPLDGTTNFAHGLPIWSVSVALEVDGRIVLGVVYDPCRREMFSALAGGGAYCNGRRIRTSGTTRLSRALLVTGFPYDIRRDPRNNLDNFRAFALKAQAVRRLGSAALDLCYTACGRFDGYWEIKLSPWDQAAGALMITEAGGCISDFAGREFDIYGDEVLASNRLIHRSMQRVLASVRGTTTRR